MEGMGRGGERGRERGGLLVPRCWVGVGDALLPFLWWWWWLGLGGFGRGRRGGGGGVVLELSYVMLVKEGKGLVVVESIMFGSQHGCSVNNIAW